jgi:RNA polymerase sigma-70 factor (ECF subfamily)
MMDETLNDPETDAEAVAAVRRGDAERYRELVERHERRVFAVAWSRLGDATLAEEATQEAFIRGYRRLWLLGDGAKFSGWITSVARNVAINLGLRHRRELNKRERWALEHPAPSNEPDSAAETDPLHTPETLRRTLAELPAAHRECLVLFYLEGKSGTEAATALGITEAALRVRLHRARIALREKLDEQLAASLQKLAPGKSIVPAVMATVLMATSAKAATGGAIGAGVGTGFWATVGKVVPVSALFPLIQVIASLPGLLIAMWVSRLEQRNFRDAKGFRVRFHQKFYRSFLWGFPVMMLLVLLPIHFSRAAWGMLGMHVWTVSFLVVMTGLSARSLAINRNPFQVGMVIYCGTITLGMLALAVGWIPASLSSLPMVLATILFISLLGKHRPMRMDYSLFLRANQRLLKAPTPDQLTHRETFNRDTLLTFARFLGFRWLAVNYRWETHGLALQLPPVKAGFLDKMASAILPMSRHCSCVVLRFDGAVLAQCNETDAAELADLAPERWRDTAELETHVSGTVQEAWRSFRAGNVNEAEQLLGEIAESEVFIVPPARAAGTRWQRIFLGLVVVAMVALMVMNWQRQRLSMVSGRNLQPVACSEAEVQATLARWGEAAAADSKAWHKLRQTMWPTEVLPPATLFSSNAWLTVRAKLFGDLLPQSGSALARTHRFLGTSDLLKAVADGWFTIEDLGLTTEEFRQTLQTAPASYRQLWFTPSESAMRNHNGQPSGYTVLMVENLAHRVLSLKKLGGLDVLDGSGTVEILRQHQVLSKVVPAGRRILPDPKLAHGTFLLLGQDPIRDTYHALVILDGFGALDQIDREACIRGILRFHHGKGLFGAVKRGDGFVIFGDNPNTFWAFESLRMLGGVDRVKDLDQWKFRPQSASAKPADLSLPRDKLDWSEIEAWVLQERLERILRERKENPHAPVRSLLEP